MLNNNKKIGPDSILKWDDKIVQLWFKHSKNEQISESERELYLWLAINRNSIYHTFWYKFRFGKNDIKTKITNN